jgi:hypothetical protein
MIKSEKLSILIYAPFFYPENSGFSNAMQSMVQALSENGGFDVDVITPTELSRESEIKWMGVNIYRFVNGSSIKYYRYLYNRLRISNFIRRKINKKKYDLIFFETFNDPLLISLLPSKIFEKLVIRLHSTEDTEAVIWSKKIIFKIRKLIINFVIKKIKYISSTNYYHIDFYKKHFLNDNIYEISNKIFFIIPNVTNINKINKISENEKKNEKIKFVSVAKMSDEGVQQKGIQDLLYALYIIDEKKIKDKIELIIIGKGKNRNALINQAKQLNLQGINFIESMNRMEITKLLLNSDVIILPSRFEGLSMFALEGIATGNVVLFSNVGGLKDLVKDNGFIFESQDINELANCICKIIDLSSSDIATMKNNSISQYLTNFSNKIVVNKFEKMINIVKSNN